MGLPAKLSACFEEFTEGGSQSWRIRAHCNTPNSRTATTCSRVTVGKPSKNSSIVSPASRYSKRVCTGTRVPQKTGVPPMTLGEMVIKLLLILESLLVKDLSGKRGV